MLNEKSNANRLVVFLLLILIVLDVSLVHLVHPASENKISDAFATIGKDIINHGDSAVENAKPWLQLANKNTHLSSFGSSKFAVMKWSFKK